MGDIPAAEREIDAHEALAARVAYPLLHRTRGDVPRDAGTVARQFHRRRGACAALACAR
jgi:hypothetical protein